jgi:hypothetical protein
MSGNLLESLKGPESQSLDAVKGLITLYNHGEEPVEMPTFYRLSGEMVLVLSNKKNGYYVVTAKACSCPSFTYRGGPCKHQRMYFAESKPHGQSLAPTLEEHDRNLHKMPKNYQRMVRMAREEAEAESLELIHKGGFKPCLPEET